MKKHKKSRKADKSMVQETAGVPDGPKAIAELRHILSVPLGTCSKLVTAWAKGQRLGSKTRPLFAQAISERLDRVAAILLSPSLDESERTRLQDDIVALFSQRPEMTSGTESSVIWTPFIRFAWNLIKGAQSQPKLAFWAYATLIEMRRWPPEDLAGNLENYGVSKLEVLQRVSRAAIAVRQYDQARRVVARFSQNFGSDDFLVEAAALHIHVLAAERRPEIMQEYAEAVIEKLQEKGNFGATRRIREAIRSSPDAKPAGGLPTGLAESYPEDTYFLKKQGATWLAVYHGVPTSIPDSVGMTYIAYLLRQPKQVVGAAELRSQVQGDGREVPSGTAGEVLDRQARREYEERLEEIEEELAKAKVNNDLSQQDKLTEERAVLREHVRSATGLGGRSREAADDGERHRQAVSAAIYRALRAIKKVHEALWQHLVDSLKIGKHLSYTPRQPTTSWTIGF